MIPVGSYGDVHPFVGLGRRLQERGHRVSILTNGYFRSLVESAGLDFVEVGTRAAYLDAISNRDIWHPRRGLGVILRLTVELGLRPGYEAIARRYVPGATVVAAAGLALGARIAQEKLGIPLATIHLQPMVLPSTYRTPVFAGVPRIWIPRTLKRWLLRASSRWIVDRAVAPRVNQFRAELGLPAVRHLLFDWWNSPTRVIGLFPDWFGPPQPDWPKQVRLTGFPLYDESEHFEDSPELDDFLGSGEPPIVFTPGSAMIHGRDYFENAAAACVRLGRRGILLTRYRSQIPGRLPKTVRHFEYTPFSRLLPRTAAIVHHGGIGTSAQALRAGIPQLITPFAHDQFDNADRLLSLGVAGRLLPHRLRPKAAAAALSSLLDSTAVATSCRNVARRFENHDALADACTILERMA